MIAGTLLCRVARLRWIALISWAVFYRYQKTPTRVSHFSLFSIKFLVLLREFLLPRTRAQKSSLSGKSSFDTLAMQSHIQPLALGSSLNPQTGQYVDELKENEAPHTAVNKRCRHAGCLDAHLLKNRQCCRAGHGT